MELLYTLLSLALMSNLVIAVKMWKKPDPITPEEAESLKSIVFLNHYGTDSKELIDKVNEYRRIKKVSEELEKLEQVAKDDLIVLTDDLVLKIQKPELEHLKPVTFKHLQ
ncbi:TPA: hypothetical protein ACMDNH_003700 [Vibrio cholerae]|uniref:hypothetical protein n=1 Tax=Vibrio cholerae TaxID=666 RepID=UPI002080A647|nr:hypothetical protein [Vibrio cholerae]EHD2267605.1 hypothetical protein [Vibrio cholerae]EJL6630050.1 hypothetical protein [Vibrio cholerae]EJL6742577.1 hypothetical protein [Vibrio cholerae]EJY4342113.1 hypothetical protein [Vibrio cholerae]